MACTCGVVLHAAVAKAAISTTPTARNPNGTMVPGALVLGRSGGLRTVLLIIITLHVKQAKINRRRMDRWWILRAGGR